MSALTPAIHTVLQVLAKAIREEKELKGTQIGKETIKLSLFVDDMILYLENPKDSTRKLLEFISEFGKVTGYKINTYKLTTFLCTSNKSPEREIKEKITFTITSDIIKNLVISLPKYTTDLHSENYKMLMKEIKDESNR